MYSIVLPLRAVETDNNFILFKNVGLKSYEKFLDIEHLHSFYLVCPKSDIPLLISTVSGTKIPFKIIPEEFITGNLKSAGNWHIQQIIKLKIQSFIQTEYYLVLDSDHYLNQKFTYSDIFCENKIKYSYEPWQTENSENYSTNSNWWIASAKIMDFDVQKLNGNNLMGVTPQVLIKSVVQELIEFLSKKYSNWEQYLCDNEFTEFTIYWIYAMKCGYNSLYTTEGYPIWKHDLSTNVLKYYQTPQVIEKSFTTPTSYFSVIQGYIQQDLTPFIIKFTSIITRKHTPSVIFLVASCLISKKHIKFSAYERLMQTINTAKSIKERVPNTFCLLIEGSILYPYAKEELSKYFDHILEYGNDEEVSRFVFNTNNVGYGELKLLEKGIEYLQNNRELTANVSHIFKISARYNLTDKFRLDNFTEGKYNFKERYDETIQNNVYITGLFSIPNIDDFYDFIKQGYHKLQQYIDRFFLIQNTEQELKLIQIYRKDDVYIVRCINGTKIHDEEWKNSKIIAMYTKAGMIEKMYEEVIPDDKVHKVSTLGVEGLLGYSGNYFQE